MTRLAIAAFSVSSILALAACAAHPGTRVDTIAVPLRAASIANAPPLPPEVVVVPPQYDRYAELKTAGVPFEEVPDDKLTLPPLLRAKLDQARRGKENIDRLAAE